MVMLSRFVVLSRLAKPGKHFASRVDLEPNEPTDKLSNVTFRECTAAGNTDNAFDIRANFLTTPVSIVFERCVARDCAGAWGSAFELDNQMTKDVASADP